MYYWNISAKKVENFGKVLEKTVYFMRDKKYEPCLDMKS